MRVFVAGATGVAGRRSVAALVAAGHGVTGTARTPEGGALLASLGAASIDVDVFDAGALQSAIAGHDAVVNLLTKIPPLRSAARAGAWEANERLRHDASTALVDAAIAAGATVFVQESLAFMYGDHGDTVIDASTAELAAPDAFSALRAAEANVARFTEHGGRGVVLRFGRFYAPESDQVAALVRAARLGFFADAGDGRGYIPAVDADDVARAVVAALGAPAGTYDVTDDTSTRAQHADALAAAVGRRRLLRAPGWLVPKRFRYLSASQRVSNQRFRDATGWAPRSANVGVGYAKVASALHRERVLPAGARLVLWLLALSSLSVGIQAAFFPRSFYDDFPFGRGWIAMDGLYNQHLVRDVGALNLSLFVITVAALLVSTCVFARTAAIAWLVYSVPHFLYHLRHLTHSMPGADKLGIVVSLGLTVIGPILLLLVRARPVRIPASTEPAAAPAPVFVGSRS